MGDATPSTSAVGRRRLLGAAALGGLGLAAGLPSGHASATATPSRVPVTERRERAVVVGSGFGGGVTALRLGQAGVRTLVLERGRRWETGPDSDTFCRMANLDGRSSWLTTESQFPGVPGTWKPCTGVIETVHGDGMTVQCGSAVGGGSLTYHGMTLQPSEEHFVAPLHVVRDLALDKQRRWVLEVDRIDTGGVVQEHKRIITDAVFLNAGSPGTTRLLVKAKAKGLVPDLPDAVGTQWGNNGDRIYLWLQMDGDPGRPQGGPACVGGRVPGSPIPCTVIHSGSPMLPPDGTRLMTLAAYGIVNPTGTWAYDTAADDAKLTWDPGGDAELQALIRERMNELTRVGGGMMIDQDAQGPSTWHPLGGVPMGDAVDRHGRVHGHKGLYVLDGARIPGSTGDCNPSMTIAALAEHSMADILRRDLRRVF